MTMESFELRDYLHIIKTGTARKDTEISPFPEVTLNLLFYLFSPPGKPYFPGVDDHIPEEAGGYIDNSILPLNSPARSSPHSVGSDSQERYSRKVFVGGLPPDIDEGKHFNLLSKEHMTN